MKTKEQLKQYVAGHKGWSIERMRNSLFKSHKVTYGRLREAISGMPIIATTPMTTRKAGTVYRIKLLGLFIRVMASLHGSGGGCKSL